MLAIKICYEGKHKMKAKNIVVLVLALCLALGAAACTAPSAAEAVDAAPQQTQAPAEEASGPEVSAQETTASTPASAEADELPETEIPTEESGDAGSATDEELLDLVLGPEIALTGQNAFTFQDPTELSSQELYMLFLYFSDYETLVKDCEDEDSGEFTFTREYISSVLSKYFKDYTLDLTQVYDYDSEQDAAVTTQVSGFGGCRNPKLVEKEWDGSTVTFTVDYYAFEDVAQTGTPYMRKTYQVEFYDGGAYYLAAIEK